MASDQCERCCVVGVLNGMDIDVGRGGVWGHAFEGGEHLVAHAALADFPGTVASLTAVSGGDLPRLRHMRGLLTLGVRAKRCGRGEGGGG